MSMRHTLGCGVEACGLEEAGLWLRLIVGRIGPVDHNFRWKIDLRLRPARDSPDYQIGELALIRLAAYNLGEGWAQVRSVLCEKIGKTKPGMC